MLCADCPKLPNREKGRPLSAGCCLDAGAYIEAMKGIDHDRPAAEVAKDAARIRREMVGASGNRADRRRAKATARRKGFRDAFEFEPEPTSFEPGFGGPDMERLGGMLDMVRRTGL